jgi:AcrR family transcriptional regulator
MKRDAQATRKRILEAATAEFSRYGIAGARIDRIAAASGSNKSMIYVYFESKEKLLRVVTDELLARYSDNVPFDPADLPEFAARLYDQNQASPEAVRLLHWDRLERGEEGAEALHTLDGAAGKIGRLEQAQQRGLISDRLSAALLFEFILALTQTGPDRLAGAGLSADHAERRQAVRDAVRRLVEP